MAWVTQNPGHFYKNMTQINKLNSIIKSSRFVPGQLVRARMGLRTNGDLHLGNLFPIVTGFLLGSALIKRGYKFEYSIYLVDQEIDSSKMPFRLTHVDSHSTVASRSISTIKSFVEKLHAIMPDIKVVYRTVSLTQRMTKFRVLLKQILESQKINLQILCPEHNVSIKAKYLNGEVSALCGRCKKLYRYDLFDKKLELLLDHDVLGVLEDNLFPIDIHIIGRDHAVKTTKKISALSFRAKLQSIFKTNKHLTLLTPLVLDQNGNKMSKTEKTGLFLSEICVDKKFMQKIINFVRKNWYKSTVTVKSI